MQHRTRLRRCVRCQKPTRPDHLIHGYGPDCAKLLGLVGGSVDTGHTGPDLLDLLNTSPSSGTDA